MGKGDEILIEHLAAGRSYSAVAKLAGVSERTIIRRMKSTVFRRRVRQARADVLERALGHLSRASAEAAITLRNLLRSDNEKIKLGAANTILTAELRFRQNEDLAADVEDLKEQVAKLRKMEKKGTKL